MGDNLVAIPETLTYLKYLPTRCVARGGDFRWISGMDNYCTISFKLSTYIHFTHRCDEKKLFSRYLRQNLRRRSYEHQLIKPLNLRLRDSRR